MNLTCSLRNLAACAALGLIGTTGLFGQITYSGANYDFNYPGPNDFYVGYYGVGSLNIAGGSVLTTTNFGLIGYSGTFYGTPGSAAGTVTVTGAGSTLNDPFGNYSPEEVSLLVGYTAPGTLNILDGGAVNSYAATVGQGPAALGTVLVNGTNSTWTLSRELVVGAGTVTVSGGGTLTSQGQPDLIIGDGATGSTGTITITGTGSSASVASNLDVGYNSTGNLNVEAGATLTSSETTGRFTGIGYGQTGTVTIAGAGTTWDNENALAVGLITTGNLNITTGGAVTTGDVTIADTAGITGTVHVDGAGSSLTDTGNITVGKTGTGMVNITNGATVTTNGSVYDVIASSAGSNGTVAVTGPGSSFQSGDDLRIGDAGTGNLTITAGGHASTAYESYLGYSAGGSGTVTVSGAGSTWQSALGIAVGWAGNGTLNISNGGVVTSGGSGPGDVVGAEGGTNAVTIDGTGSAWNNLSGMVLGNAGSGSISITNGATETVTGLGEIGNGGTATLTVDGAGSTFSQSSTLSNYLYVATSGTATINLSNGGTAKIDGGQGTVYLGLSTGAVGTLNLGGTATGPAQAGGILNAAAVTTGNLGGLGTGVVQFNTTATSSAPYYFTTTGTSAGTAIAISGYNEVINTAGFNVLNGANTYMDGTQINGGTLEIGAGGSLQNNATISNNGATFILAAGATVSGTGTLNQAAGSTTTLTGNLTQGALNINGGNFSSTGDTTITGQAVNSGKLILGPGGIFDVQGAFFQTASGASALLHGATFESSGINVSAGLFGGAGYIQGAVEVSNGVVQIGASPDQLAISGSYDQTGGSMEFEIDPDNLGGFLTSTLAFEAGQSLSITDTDIVFNFLNGADPDVFFSDGLFNLNTFFTLQGGGSLGSAYDLNSIFVDDTFTINLPNETVTGSDLDTGALFLNGGGGGGSPSVPDAAATWPLLLVSVSALAVWRRGARARRTRSA